MTRISYEKRDGDNQVYFEMRGSKSDLVDAFVQLTHTLGSRCGVNINALAATLPLLVAMTDKEIDKTVFLDMNKIRKAGQSNELAPERLLCGDTRLADLRSEPERRREAVLWRGLAPLLRGRRVLLGNKQNARRGYALQRAHRHPVDRRAGGRRRDHDGGAAD